MVSVVKKLQLVDEVRKPFIRCLFIICTYNLYYYIFQTYCLVSRIHTPQHFSCTQKYNQIKQSNEFL